MVTSRKFKTKLGDVHVSKEIVFHFLNPIYEASSFQSYFIPLDFVKSNSSHTTGYHFVKGLSSFPQKKETGLSSQPFFQALSNYAQAH